MPNDKTRKRMIVEEVDVPSENPTTEVVNSEPVEEIKEKVEELQNITESISESIEKSAEVQEDIAKAAEEVIPSETPEKQPEEKESKEAIIPEIRSGSALNPLLIIIPGIFLLGALLGGIVFYQNRVSNKTNSTEPTPTPDYTNMIESPTPTPAPELDITKYPINVMNGSGISGQAGVVKDILTTAGFKVSKTGNAESYDFTKTAIKAKADVPEVFITKLTETLSKNYVMDTKQSLATSSADSVQVIVGSIKK